MKTAEYSSNEMPVCLFFFYVSTDWQVIYPNCEDRSAAPGLDIAVQDGLETKKWDRKTCSWRFGWDIPFLSISQSSIYWTRAPPDPRDIAMPKLCPTSRATSRHQIRWCCSGSALCGKIDLWRSLNDQSLRYPKDSQFFHKSKDTVRNPSLKPTKTPQ